MSRLAPVLWSAVHIGIVSATTWLLVASELLDTATVFIPY